MFFNSSRERSGVVDDVKVDYDRLTRTKDFRDSIPILWRQVFASGQKPSEFSNVVSKKFGSLIVEVICFWKVIF